MEMRSWMFHTVKEMLSCACKPCPVVGVAGVGAGGRKVTQQRERDRCVHRKGKDERSRVRVIFSPQSCAHTEASKPWKGSVTPSETQTRWTVRLPGP